MTIKTHRQQQVVQAVRAKAKQNKVKCTKVNHCVCFVFADGNADGDCDVDSSWCELIK